MPTRAQAKVTTDHDEIRQWAEERGAKPACVRNTGDEGDIGILRLDFPGYSGGDSLQEISWEDFFEKFDERGLALLHQETTARGQKSNFNKLVSRETAEAQGRGRSRSGGRTSAWGRATRSSRASSRGDGRKTAAKKSAGRGERKAAGRKSSTKSRSASSKRASRSAGSSSRRSKTKSASRTTRKTTVKKSASSGRSQANRGRTNAGGRNNRSGKAQSRASRSSAGSRILTDHDEIRQWAEERKASPACVRGTGRKKNDMGMIRLDFPGYSGARSLQEINWEDWFRQFDDNNLSLVVQDSTARGQRSNFNKLIGRETAQEREEGGHARRRHPERGRKTEAMARVSGSRAQVKSTRGSSRGSRTASARGQHREQERRAA